MRVENTAFVSSSLVNDLLNQFLVVFQAVAQIGLIVLFAGWLVRRQILPASGVKMISDTVITVFLPCLIFSHIVGGFYPAEFKGWWILPISSAVLISIGWAISFPLFSRTGEARRELIPAAFLQNAAYFILPLGKIILPEQFDEFARYVFLFILAHNPLLWLIGKHYFLKRGSGEPFHWIQILSPPIYANIIALTLVATGARPYVPTFMVDTAAFLGGGAVPLGTFALGATLGTIHINFRRYLTVAGLVVFQKLFIMPLIVLGAMALVPWLRSSPVLILLFILQGASPCATSLILQSKSYSDDSERIGTIIAICYIVCTFSIPLWVAISSILYL